MSLNEAITGIDLAITLNKLMPGCKVLLISGASSLEARLEDAAETGYSFEVLRKPIHPSQIAERLKDLLS